jgi:hypothetical protein
MPENEGHDYDPTTDPGVVSLKGILDEDERARKEAELVVPTDNGTKVTDPVEQPEQPE